MINAQDAFANLYAALRPDSALAMDQFLAAHEVRAGGVVVVRAAWKMGNRSVPEVVYATERWDMVVRDGMAPGRQP